MIDITRRAEVHGSPHDVVAFVSHLDRWPEWFALHKGWVGDVPSEARVGVRFAHKVRILGVPGEVTWEVAEFDVPRRIVLKGRSMSRTSMEVDFGIDAAPAGSLVAFTAKIKGLALLPVKHQLGPWVEARADRTLEALAALLEAEHGRAA
ncbi:MAG TPA: SRPBCC family protein [Baekduia sp.]|nr:SRPBCC family protein [Baekduia sp.]